MIRVAGFRPSSEMRGETYWMGKDKKKCKVCGWKRETWEHVLEQCAREVKAGETRRVEFILQFYEAVQSQYSKF